MEARYEVKFQVDLQLLWISYFLTWAYRMAFLYRDLLEAVKAFHLIIDLLAYVTLLMNL